MGLPASEQFTPTPHQRLTAIEFVRRVEQMYEPKFDIEPSSYPEFWVGALKDGYCGYGGEFMWDDSSKTLKSVDTVIGNFIIKRDRWVTNHHLCYKASKSDNWHYNVKVVEMIFFKCFSEEHVAYWNKKLMQWILAIPYKYK